MLQFIAPLVHAHAGQQNPDLGLHIPGLETFSASEDLFASEPAICYSSSDGFIFSVHDGINPKRVKIDANILPSLYFPQFPAAPKPVTPSVDCQFIPHHPQFVSQFTTLPLSPRAPPSS